MRLVRIIKAELHQRSRSSPEYGAKDFAREVGISPGYLSLLLAGKRRVTEKVALSICKSLRSDEADKAKFMAVYRSEATRDPEYRSALKRLIDPSSSYRSIESKDFSPVSKWHHTAIIELSYLASFKPEPHWIARRLGISPVEADLSLARLLRLGFLKKDASGAVRADQQVAVKDMPSKAIREHHAQMVLKGLESIEGQKPADRHVSGVTIAISKSKLAAANDLICEFRERFAALVHAEENDAVYQLNVQFFRLDKEQK